MRSTAPLLAMLLMLGAACASSGPSTAVTPGPGSRADATSATPSVAAAGEPEGTETFTDLLQDHVSFSPVEYPQIPPVGGPHWPVWQDCAFYDAVIPPEQGVHSMEHGAVWITYSPDLAAADLDVLADLAATGDHILVSPFEGLPSPVVASAWGKQLALPGVDDPRLQQFVDRFQNGRQTPEPGAACAGGASAPA